MYSPKDIIQDTFLIEFFQKKTREVFLVNQEQAHKHAEYLNQRTDGLVCTDICFERAINGAIEDETLDIPTIIKEYFPVVLQCLELCGGKLCYCGTLEELFCTYDNKITQTIHLYFCDCSIVKANELLIRCLKLFSGEKYIIEDKGIFIYCLPYNVIFHTTICKNIQELLLYRGHLPERQLWNSVDGYVTTLSTAIAIGMSAYPLDITLPCNRLDEYDALGMSIIFHGLKYIDALSSYSNDDEEYCINRSIYNAYRDKLELPDCTLYFHEEETIVQPRKSSAYPINLLNANNERHTLPPILFINESLEEIVDKCNLRNFQPIVHPKFNLGTYLGKDYKIYIAGIDNDRYVAIVNCTKYYNMPNELLQLLCYHWLKQEALLARDRLLSLGN